MMILRAFRRRLLYAVATRAADTLMIRYYADATFDASLRR